MSVLLAQPLPGIGDMIWHLPHIRAVADYFGHPVTLLAKKRSLADQLLADEPAVHDIIWLDMNPADGRGAHDGVAGIVRLAALLRTRRFDRMMLLHHGTTLAVAGMLAGIRRRQGYGWGAQRRFLTDGPYLPRSVAWLHQHTRATRFLAAAGIPLPSDEPHFPIPSQAMQHVRHRLARLPRPFVAMGIGSSEGSRQLGAARMAGLARRLLDAGWPAVVLIGGPGDDGLAAAILAGMGDRANGAFVALGWNLAQVAAALRQAAFYLGNNTGVMNLAAAVGIRTYALFGTTPPFFHASQIVAITSPPGGPDDGMARVTETAVIDAILADRGTLLPAVAQEALPQPAG